MYVQGLGFGIAFVFLLFLLPVLAIVARAFRRMMQSEHDRPYKYTPDILYIPALH